MPAVNPGISVSRVGGNAQIKAMKKVAGTLKLIYSQYRELASFAQFGSDLDADTKMRLEQGARIVEVLKQKQNAPVPVEKQVAILYAVTKGILSKVVTEDVELYEEELYIWLDTDARGAEVMQVIRESGKLEKETEENLCAAAVVFPDLQDRKLWESYGAKSSVEVLQKMLTPAEYLRLQKAVMVLNGFQKRKAERRETAKN